ncbi:MAG: hypothetical protein WCD45_02625 [Gallionella sp.]
MKKIVLSLAGVMAVAAFAPEASALPVFARQTGMACSACHFQHFPLLNGFGRAFKEAGFTMMGAQGKVEEAGSLSIPAELNMAVLTSMGYGKTNQTVDPSGVGKNPGNGVFGVPGVGGGGSGEASLFFGGHVSENAGFLSEVTLGGAGAALGSAKLPMLWEVADGTRAGLVPFATNGQGASYGMEVLNTGANAIHQISNTVGYNGEFAGAISAQQWLGTATNATGAALVATNDSWFVNATKFDQTGTTAGAYGSLGSTYLRAAAMMDVAGWDTGFGIQSWSGSSLTSVVPASIGGATPTTINPAAGGVMQQTKATAIDGQMQGEMGGMPVGFYATYATAPAALGAVTPNTYNGGTLTRSSFNLAAEVGVVPGVATVGAAIRRGNSGVADATGANATDNAIYLTATYKIQQNMLARLSYVNQSGSFWSQTAPAGTVNPNGQAATATTNAQIFGTSTTMLNMYVLF